MISSTPRCLVLLLLAILLIPSTGGRHDGGDLVNAVIGNMTADAKYDETTRVRMHLEAVAQRLAEADVASMTPALQRARSQNIERLRAYARACVFPRKPESVPGRTPNFVDDRGVVCAVGYLLEQNCGRAAVMEIARTHQFDYVPYIDSPLLAAWQATSGLTMLELAMIQPMYGPPPLEPEPNLLSDQETGEILFLVGDLVTSVINLTFVAHGKGNTPMGIVGCVVGAGSIAFGMMEDRDTPLIAGLVTGALGIASIAFANSRSPDPPPVVSAIPFVGRIGGEQSVGLLATMRF